MYRVWGRFPINFFHIFLENFWCFCGMFKKKKENLSFFLWKFILSQTQKKKVFYFKKNLLVEPQNCFKLSFFCQVKIAKICCGLFIQKITSYKVNMCIKKSDFFEKICQEKSIFGKNINYDKNTKGKKLELW